ncbi:hypothetical protein JTB14_004756 [Gonioctena quinquepunctata]|nr:hypothetical protein JTB14_004756 [Gonioctena quinquepunctata]
MSILNEKCLTGLQNPFDCDGDQETPIDTQSENYEFEFIHDTEDEGGDEENPRKNLSQNKVKNFGSNFEKNALQKKNELDETSESGSGTHAWKKLKSDNLKLPLNSALHCAGPSGVMPTTKAKKEKTNGK